MTYPFRFKIGDNVQIMDGHYKDHRGQITALELTAKKTVAVVNRGPNSTPVREVESKLRLLS